MKTKHFLKKLAGLLFIVFLIFSCTKILKSEVMTIRNLSAKESHKLIQKNLNNKNFIILDVRTKEEFFSGRIRNSINLNFYSRNFLEELNNFDKNSTYLIYCRSGNRSSKTLEIMKNLGFKKVYNMENGIIEWKEKGYEIIK